VQIARTYSILFTPLSPYGSTTPLDAFLRAISKAKHFIYIEDQYLFPFAGPDAASPDTVGILTALLNALDRGIEYLVIVGPHHLADSQASYRKALFLSILLARGAQAQTNRVRLYYPVRGNREDARLSQASGEGDDTSSGIHWPDEEYVHSKVWIVDDICAKIGSANCNRRSYTNDHELDVVVIDSAIRDGYRGFARDLRVNLWAEHLNISVGENLALCQNLYDYRTAIEMLEDFVVQGAGRLRRHVPDIANTGGKSDTFGFWDHISDPDGRVPN
jgi:phosphatidylserine/phosphatidylglycerophosphate/cardiolipin synthase-like enzyme